MAFESDKKWVLEKPIVYVMVKLGLPVGLMQVMRVIYTIVDLYWLGNYNPLTIAGLSSAWPVIFLVLSSFFGFFGGGIALVSQYWGAGSYQKSVKVSGQMLFFSLTAGSAVSITLILVSPFLLHVLGIPEVPRYLAFRYISVIAFGIPVFGILESIVAVYIATGNPFIPLALRSAGVLLNMLLDPIFIYGWYGLPEMGIMGAALATLLSELMCGLIGLLIFLSRGIRGEKFRVKYLKPDISIIKTVVKIGAPISGTAVVESLGFTILAGIIATMGEKALAAWGVGDRPFSVVSIAVASLISACSVIVGQSLGAELYERARTVASKTLLYAVTITAFIVAPIILFRKQLSMLFSPLDDEIAHLASEFIVYMGPSLIFLSILETARAVASGSGHTKPMMYISFIRLLLLRNILAYLLGPGPLGIGVTGLWVGMGTSNIVAGLLALAWLRKYTWLKPVIKERTS